MSVSIYFGNRWVENLRELTWRQNSCAIFILAYAAGLPDFSWDMIPKPVELTQNVPNAHKIFVPMSIK
jgi:hypothetical protein